VSTISNLYKGIKGIGIVCLDNLRLGPVAAYILRDLLVKSKNAGVRGIQVSDAGIKRLGSKVSDATKGFLQQKGFGTTDLMEPKRVNKYWLQSKDVIFTMDRFQKRDLIYDFFPNNQEMGKKFLVITEAAGIKEKIRDPLDDFNIDIKPVFQLIEKCCIEIFKKIEANY
jgi:protein-tyrosine-phosphatase